MSDQPSSGLSWEEIVNRVTIASNYAKLAESAAGWDAAFKRIDKLRDDVKALATQSERSWQGGDATRFRRHLQGLATALDQTAERHRKVHECLTECKTALQTAVQTIPVPSWKYSEVLAARNAYATRGELTQVAPGSFLQGLSVLAGVPLVGDAYRAAEEYIRNNTQIAQRAYDTLCAAYAAILAQMPEGVRVDVPRINRSLLSGANARNPNARTARQPTNPLLNALGQPNMMTPAMMQPLTPAALTPADLTPPSSGLAGVDPSTLPGLRAGDFAGLSSSGPGGIGGKLGGGGIGGGLPPIGPSVGPPAGVIPVAGGTGGARTVQGAQRLATGGTGQSSTNMAAAAPVLGAAGAGRSERQAHEANLSEEWVFDTNLPDSVLGA